MRILTEKQRELKRAQQRKGPLSRIEIKAIKEQHDGKSKFDIMWNELLDGQTFENYKMKKAL